MVVIGNNLALRTVFMASVWYHVVMTWENEETHVVGLNQRFLLDDSRQFTGWASWEQFAACSTTCVKGYETQTKECCDTGNNRICYYLPWDTLRPYIGTCTVDGIWSAWSQYTDCTVTCGGGTQNRTRTCTYAAGIPHGRRCPGYSSEVHDCNTRACSVNGGWAEWQAWDSKCSVTCGGGVITRFRTCTNPTPSNGGLYCSGSFEETKHCAGTPCPVDGTWSEWTQFSACNVSCGGGTRIRSRVCVFTPVAPHGKGCVGDHKETDSCNNNLCPVDGVWTHWSSWGACSTTCDLGHRYRHRDCAFVDIAPHGETCKGKNEESSWCRVALCIVDGIWSAWTQWSQCSTTCGSGNMTRSRLCAFPVPGAPHGKNCTGDSIEYKTCDHVSAIACS